MGRCDLGGPAGLDNSRVGCKSQMTRSSRSDDPHAQGTAFGPVTVELMNGIAQYRIGDTGNERAQVTMLAQSSALEVGNATV